MRRDRAVLLGVPLAAVAFAAGVSLAAPQHMQHRAAAGSVEADAAPGQEFLDERLLTGDRAPADDAFRVIGQEALGVRAQTTAQDPSDAAAAWQWLGPSNVDNPHPASNDGGGRVPDLAVDPKHAGTVYVATAGGGIWKTTDAGAHFTSVWPNSYPQAIGAIAVAPDGTVWAGTGETNPGGGSITFYGDGIYRSTDGGATWTDVGLTDSWTIARIVVNPLDPEQVWVAVSGNLFLSGHERGVYESADAESVSPPPTWTQSLAPPNGTTGASDLAMSQQHPNVIYAAMWDHQRQPDSETYTGAGSGVWKTSDGGASWTDLTSPANAATDGLLADGDTAVGRIGLAVAPSNDQDVYVNYANDPNGVFLAWFVSTDGGTLFTQPPQAHIDLDVPVTNGSYVYGWWFAKTFVDPTNPLHVFVTGLCLWSSSDGGNSFPNDDCSVHADQHAMEWDPNVPNQVYLGDDGGFYTSTQNGAVGSWNAAPYQPWPQFDGLDVSEQDPSRIIGGLQDNGSQRDWNSSGQTVSAGEWNSVYGGDGQENLIDPQNQDIVYSCLQYGVCQVSGDGGNTGTEFDTTPLSLNQNCATCTHTTRNAYFTPMAFDPSNPSTVYYGGDEINESNDNGNTWRVISPNLGGPDPGRETDPVYAGHYGAATTIAVSPSNDNIVWVGTDSGYVWYTTDALSNPAMPAWTQVAGPGIATTLPTQFVSKLLIDPANPQIVFLSFSGYRSGDDTAFIERTDDSGGTWTNLSDNLPEATVNSLALVGGRLYAATDTGVYVSDPSEDPLTGPSITWRQVGMNLPDIAVTGMRYVPENGTLYVSTFGRGIWSLVISSPQTQIPEVPAPLFLPAGAALIGAAAAVLRRRRRAIQAA